MPDAVKSLNDFKTKSKFDPDTVYVYPGIADMKLKPVLTSLVNAAADDFIEVAGSHPTHEKYLEKMRAGLDRFSPYYMRLDTEERERIALYFQELMDAVGLESSEGILNDWLYGVDPAEDNKP